MDHNDPSQFCQFATCQQSSIVLHTSEKFCYTSFACLFVVFVGCGTHHELSPLLATHYRLRALDMYKFCPWSFAKNGDRLNENFVILLGKTLLQKFSPIQYIVTVLVIETLRHPGSGYRHG